MPIEGILEQYKSGKIIMVLKEIESMTDGEYRIAVEEEFKKLNKSKEKT